MPHRLCSILIFGFLSVLANGEAQVVSDCLRMDDEKYLGVTIGEKVSNLPRLSEKIEAGHRFFKIYYCVDPDDDGRLTGI